MLAIYVSTCHHYFINHSRMLGEVKLFSVYSVNYIWSTLVQFSLLSPIWSILFILVHFNTYVLIRSKWCTYLRMGKDKFGMKVLSII